MYLIAHSIINSIARDISTCHQIKSAVHVNSTYELLIVSGQTLYKAISPRLGHDTDGVTEKSKTPEVSCIPVLMRVLATCMRVCVCVCVCVLCVRMLATCVCVLGDRKSVV